VATEAKARAVDRENAYTAAVKRRTRVGREAASQSRHVPLRYPANVTRTAVVRIESAPGARLDIATVEQVKDLLLRTASRPGIAALQVDFDAKRSERGFYAALLRSLRSQMPPQLPLSIAALASWCSNDDWISGLPIDEAVPMLFRMEPDRRQAADRPQFRHSRTEMHGKRRYLDP
jgi:hypothetical protein